MKPAIKHTPGPWHASTREKYTLGGDSVEIVRLTRDGEWVEDHIADVGLCTGDDTEDDRAIWKEQEANARLIAAAPDLLESLKEAVDVIESCLEIRDLPLSCRDVAPKANAAITKAEGKEASLAPVGESRTFEVRQTGWLCPQCDLLLKQEDKPASCPRCGWTIEFLVATNEFAGDGSRREVEHPPSIGLSVASPVASEGGKDWPVQRVHHVPIPADADHPCPACKTTQPTPPPVSNEFVAEGCEQFTSPQIDALTAVAREILKWENAAMIPGYRLIEIVEMARKALGTP